MPPPLVLLEDPGSLPVVRARLVREGWHVQDGWELGAGSWDVTERRVVCAGSVSDLGARQAALMAGARGAGLIVIAGGDPDPELVEDLERLGPVERRPAMRAPGSLDSETLDLLRALAEGRSVAQAAGEALVSLRTAHRRLAQARRALGARSNRELLVEYARRYPRR